MAFRTLALNLALSWIWALAENPPAANLRAQKTPVNQPAAPVQMMEEVAATAPENSQLETGTFNEKTKEPQKEEEEKEALLEESAEGAPSHPLFDAKKDLALAGVEEEPEKEKEEALLQASEKADGEDGSATAEDAEKDGKDEALLEEDEAEVESAEEEEMGDESLVESAEEEEDGDESLVEGDEDEEDEEASFHPFFDVKKDLALAGVGEEPHEEKEEALIQESEEAYGKDGSATAEDAEEDDKDEALLEEEEDAEEDDKDEALLEEEEEAEVESAEEEDMGDESLVESAEEEEEGDESLVEEESDEEEEEKEETEDKEHDVDFSDDKTFSDEFVTHTKGW